MTPNNEGLTVGELTIALGVLIIVFLIWSGLNKKSETDSSHIPINSSYIVVQNK